MSCTVDVTSPFVPRAPRLERLVWHIPLSVFSDFLVLPKLPVAVDGLPVKIKEALDALIIQ